MYIYQTFDAPAEKVFEEGLVRFDIYFQYRVGLRKSTGHRRGVEIGHRPIKVQGQERLKSSDGRSHPVRREDN